MKTKTILLSLLSLSLLSCGNDYSDYDPEAMARTKESADMCYRIFTDWEKTDSLYIKAKAKNIKGDSVDAITYQLKLKKDSDTLLIASTDWQTYFDTIMTTWNASIFGSKEVVAQICHSHIDIHDDYYNDKKIGIFECPKSRPLINPSSDPSIQAGINYLHGEGIRTEKLTYCETHYIIDIDRIVIPDAKDKEAVIAAYKQIKDADLVFGYSERRAERTDSLRALNKYDWIKEHQYAYFRKGRNDEQYKVYEHALIHANNWIEDNDRYISALVSKKGDLERILKENYWDECAALGIERKIDTILF